MNESSRGIVRRPTQFSRVAAAVRSATDTGLGRLILFGAIGLSGFAPNLVSLIVMNKSLGMHYVLATLIASQIAIVWNFVLLDQLVYRRARSGPWYRRAGAFAAVNNLDLLLRVPMLAVLVECAHIDCIVATVITLVGMFVIRFVVTDRLIYHLRRQRSNLIIAEIRTDVETLVTLPRSLAIDET